jgi:arylsulfatase
MYSQQHKITKPNILAFSGDEIGQASLKAYAFGVLGYKTANMIALQRNA